MKVKRTIYQTRNRNKKRMRKSKKKRRGGDPGNSKTREYLVNKANANVLVKDKYGKIQNEEVPYKSIVYFYMVMKNMVFHIGMKNGDICVSMTN